MKTRWVTVSILTLLTALVLVRDRGRGTFAADADDTTWGAADPTWSPDGATLAFSLFGSIWTVPAAGGEAVQLTSSPGYHAHPAWSPAGDRIAFVRGEAPEGQWPHISGKLILLDTKTGQEREIQTPFPVSGTIAWAPDGKSVAVSLRNILHEIPVAGGGPKRLQGPGSGIRPDGAWTYIAWNPRLPELYYTLGRSGPPQVWSIDAAGPAIVIQKPLTHYRPDARAFLEGLAALPDGSGFVMAANPVNQVGNFELYRVPRDGGEPVRLTNTPRDEFSPAISPDGRQVAFVSNALGNLDLFTMPVSGGDQMHVRITELKFQKPSSRIRLRFSDERGAPTHVRLYVRASDGKAYCPPGAPIFYFPMRGTERDGFFIASGDVAFPVPAGKLKLVAFKGTEYEPEERDVTISPGETTEAAMQLRRWANWNQRGWYSGEDHIHANYGGSYYIRPKQSSDWMDAEDLNVANMTVANFQGGYVHDKEFFNGQADPLSSPSRILYYGQEFRNSGSLGHMAFLNIKRLVAPIYSGFAGSASPWDYPLNTAAAQDAAQQGGLVSYVHPTQGERDVFDQNGGAKEAPVTAALGALHAFEVLPSVGYDIWYLFLNSGFKVSPGAGTDTFTNWRGINRFPGAGREYVEVGPAMNWERWIERYKQGRNFVTNGPLLSFQVNGEPMGAQIRVPAGSAYTANLTAEAVWRLPLQTMEFIENGQVIETRRIPPGEKTFRMEKRISVSRSSWFAVRVTGDEIAGISRPGRAHSGTVHVTVGGKPVLVERDLETMIRWVDRLWEVIEEARRLGPGNNRERARETILKARRHYEEKLKQARP